jgi:hypothetical protein
MQRIGELAISVASLVLQAGAKVRAGERNAGDDSNAIDAGAKAHRDWPGFAGSSTPGMPVVASLLAAVSHRVSA